MTKPNNTSKERKEYRSDDVWVSQLNGKWRCIAYTHNWASDIFEAFGKTFEEAVEKVIGYCEKDSKDGVYLLPELRKLLL